MVDFGIEGSSGMVILDAPVFVTYVNGFRRARVQKHQ
jgi:hypothetical protein